ncbi:MAG: hypothetical protein ACTSQJ_02570 [Promethearchaeota archaeon]
MTYEAIYLQITFISLFIVIFGLILNKLLGLKADIMKEIRDQALNLFQRLKNARLLGDYRQIQELQLESMRLAKTMMKKQVIPLCFKCIIFFVIWVILSFIYSDYGMGSDFFFGYGWFAFYFLLTISFSFAAFGIKQAFLKITKKEDKRRIFAKEIFGMLSQGQRGITFGNIPPVQSSTLTVPYQAERKDAWKERIRQTSESDDSRATQIPSPSIKKDAWKDRLEK